MKKKKEIVNFELSNYLKACRVKQNSLFYWVQREAGIWELRSRDNLKGIVLPKFSAFTKKEIKRIFSDYICGTGLHVTTIDSQITRTWVCNAPGLLHTTQADTETNALAKMLIWLLENKKV